MMLQKAVTPGVVQAYLGHGFDRVSGWVVPAGDVSELTSLEQLRELHHLDFPGTPIAAGEPIYILHFPAPATLTLVRANPQSMSELFTLPNNGQLTVGDVTTTLYWLEHTRLAAGTRLWRFDGSGEPQLAGTYNGPAFGWQDPEDNFHAVSPSPVVGRIAVVDEQLYVAEPELDEEGAPVSVTLTWPVEPQVEGFTETDAGVWAKMVDYDDVSVLAEAYATTTWKGMPARVVERFELDGRDVARIASLVLDFGANREAGYDLVEPGVWEKTVGWDELEDVEQSLRVAKAWARPEELENSELINAEQDAADRAQQGREAVAGQAQASVSGVSGDDPIAKPESRQALAEIVQQVSKLAPENAERVEMLIACVNTSVRLSAQAILPQDQMAPVEGIGEEIVPAIGALRHHTARPDGGAFFAVFLAISPDGKVQASFNYNEQPVGLDDLSAEDWKAELERYPRTPEHIPAWLQAKIEGE